MCFAGSLAQIYLHTVIWASTICFCNYDTQLCNSFLWVPYLCVYAHPKCKLTVCKYACTSEPADGNFGTCPKHNKLTFKTFIHFPCCCLVFRKTKDLYLIITQKLIILKSGGFHEILGHSPHPAFVKLKSFCWNTCFYKVFGGFHMKSAGFHGWNLGEIRQISRVKSGWNPPDFMGEIRRISKDQLPGMVSPMFPWIWYGLKTQLCWITQ